MTPTLPKFWPEKKPEYPLVNDDYDMGFNNCLELFTALYLKGELVAKSELPTENELEEIIANTSTTTRIGHSTLSKAIATAISKRMRGEGKPTSNHDTSTESELYQKGYEQGKNWVVNNPGLFGLSTCRVMDREDIKCILDLERRLFSHDTWLEFKSRVASAIIKYLTERG